MNLVELSFPIRGRAIPENNGYLLYAAISRTLDCHLPEGVAVASIGGPVLGGWRLGLGREASLRVRTPAEHIGALLPLAGRFLDVGGEEIVLGVPRVHALEPSEVLISRLVTIKGYTEPGPFLEAAGRQLAELGITGDAEIPPVPGGARTGRPQRRVLRLKGLAIVGFAMRVSALSPDHSLRLMGVGLGGRRRMGCGIFEPEPIGGRGRDGV